MNIPLHKLCCLTAAVIENGRLSEVVDVLAEFGIKAVIQLHPTQYSEYESKIKAIGGETP